MDITIWKSGRDKLRRLEIERERNEVKLKEEEREIGRYRDT